MKPKDITWRDLAYELANKKPEPVWKKEIDGLFREGNVLALFKNLLACEGVKFERNRLEIPALEVNGKNLKAAYCYLCLMSHKDGASAMIFSSELRQKIVDAARSWLQEQSFTETKDIKKVMQLFLAGNVNGLLNFLQSRKNVKFDTAKGFILPQLGKKGKNFDVFLAHKFLIESPGGKYAIENLALVNRNLALGVKKIGDHIVYAFGILERKRIWLPVK